MGNIFGSGLGAVVSLLVWALSGLLVLSGLASFVLGDPVAGVILIIVGVFVGGAGNALARKLSGR